MRAGALILVLAALSAAGAPASADDLKAVYARILADPTNTDLNLQYALIAEGRGEYRKALAAYERILANDPGNADAKRGLQRVRRILQPPFTRVTLESGGLYDTNPLRQPGGSDAEFTLYAKAQVRDERVIGGTRWRSVASIFADAHTENDNLNYAVLKGDIGPILDIPGTMMAIRPEFGAAIATLSGDLYYYEVNLGATVEGYLDGAYQFGGVSVGWREYDPSFTSDSGFYVDARGRLAKPKLLTDRDVLSLSPWFRWSQLDGSVFDVFSNEITPGKYVAGGARLQYDSKVADWLSVGVFVAVSDRLYTTTLAPDGSKRQDFLVSPGIALLFDDVLGKQADLNVEYAFEHNDSNDPAHDWDNHSIKVSVRKRM